RRASASDVATLGYATLNGGTKGGVGGPTTRVSTLAALTAAVAGNSSAIVIVSGTITGNTVVKVGSNKSVLGASGASLVGVGLRVLNEQNVIIRNLKISKVLASAGDAIGIQASNQVWVDHVDLSSDLAHDKDYYDGLLDVTHGCVGITITNSAFHDHWKASLVGHSDKNGAQDVKITVTYANNYWYNINSRTPSLRFGHGHVFNTFFLNNNLGIDTRDAAQMLIENNVWSNSSSPIYQTDTGYAVATGNDFGGGANTAPLGTFTKAPYSYTLLPTSSVRSSVVGSAGATLSF
ncbi:polysaccharide lyase family 1 protein, partial [Rickenella mellea]